MKYPNDWFDYANDDIEAGEILLREGKHNLACFHSQQAAEKALKGFLAHTIEDYPRIHNLRELLSECLVVYDSFNDMKLQIVTLNQFYAPTRYPDASVGSLPSGLPNMSTAKKALMYAKEIFDFCIHTIEQIERKHNNRSVDR